MSGTNQKLRATHTTPKVLKNNESLNIGDSHPINNIYNARKRGILLKINNLGSMGVNPYKRSLEKSAAAAQKPQTKVDKVEISSKAIDLQQSNEVTKARQEKVQAIKTQLESGTYTIDPKAIATGLLNFYKK